MKIGTNIQIDPTKLRALVSLKVEITPDPKWQPYNITVVIAGAFTGERVSTELFDRFCREGVPPILFPYVREIVHHTTMDGRYGAVRVEPINLADLTKNSNWGDPTPLSTEPDLLLEQPPLAAED